MIRSAGSITLVLLRWGEAMWRFPTVAAVLPRQALALAAEAVTSNVDRWVPESIYDDPRFPSVDDPDVDFGGGD
jgi:hypothetical protein